MSDTPTPFPHRTVLVTGAGKRLGREIALTLARAGWSVAVHFRQSATEAQQTAADCDAASGRPGSAATFGADLADEAAVRALVPAVLQRFGRLDILVSNAGIASAAPSATGLLRTMPVAWKNRIVAITPALTTPSIYSFLFAAGLCSPMPRSTVSWVSWW